MGGTVLHINAVGLMAAIEEAKDRGLRTRPFVVAREDVPRSIVLDVSPEAHREGIKRGMMLSLALRRLPGLAVREPRPELYRAADESMWRIGMAFSPIVEKAGHGHLFIDLAGTARLNGPPEDATQRIRVRIMEETGITPSFALASNKTVSKIATRVFRPGGFIAFLPHEERSLVRLQPVDLLPGVGSALKDRLDLLDIENIGSLADLGAFEARAIGPRGPDLVVRACCVDDSPVNPEPPERRSLAGSAVFEPDTAEPGLIRLHLAYVAATLGFAARKENLGPRRITVRLDYTDGRSGSATLRVSRLLTRDNEIAAAAWTATQKALERRVRVRRLALELSEFASAGPELDLFDPTESKSVRLQSALDLVHGKYGFPALTPCALLAAGAAAGRFLGQEA
jgi:DNA polymerase IV